MASMYDSLHEDKPGTPALVDITPYTDEEYNNVRDIIVWTAVTTTHLQVQTGAYWWEAAKEAIELASAETTQLMNKWAGLSSRCEKGRLRVALVTANLHLEQAMRDMRNDMHLMAIPCLLRFDGAIGAIGAIMNASRS